MAHVGRWETVCFDVLQDHLRGQQPAEDYGQATIFNERWESELQVLWLSEAIDLFETAYHRLFGFLSGLRPEQWNGYIRAWVTGSIWHHFEEHAQHRYARLAAYAALLHV